MVLSKRHAEKKQAETVRKQLEGRLLGAANECSKSQTAIQHGIRLGITREGTDDKFMFLMLVALGFVQDERGGLNENATGQAFTSAVLNITPEILESARTLTGGIDQNGRTTFASLLAASGAFVRQVGQFDRPVGQFDGPTFNAAFRNLDSAKIQKTTQLARVTPDVALLLLLKASKWYVTGTGAFDPARFNARFDGLVASQFRGDEKTYPTTFMVLMKP
jgi:hypothetical protein